VNNHRLTLIAVLLTEKHNGINIMKLLNSSACVDVHTFASSINKLPKRTSIRDVNKIQAVDERMLLLRLRTLTSYARFMHIQEQCSSMMLEYISNGYIAISIGTM
jgi:hypothetical protein